MHIPQIMILAASYSIQLHAIDYAIIAIFFVVVVGIGIWASRSAGESSAEFFLGGRGMPWWLLGISMVACTFSADTPNLVTGMVRESGVSKNWAWWAFLITGMVTVFIYAKLWRRSNVMTDLEFYELRYGGKPASFLRGFRSIYLGIFFNVLIMASVTLAIIKYGSLMFGLEKWECVLYGSLGVVIYATLGGLKGCIWADFFQYGIAMFGAVYAAVVALGEAAKTAAERAVEAGTIATDQATEFARNYSMADLLHEANVSGKIKIFPDFSDSAQWVPLLFIPVAVQWWSVWYPGAEPGGGGYIAQRMLAAKDEKNAIGATLLFNFAHYALRPWPWIIVALASLVCFPELTDIQSAFPHVNESVIAQDIAYPAMISKLKPGFLGIVIASIIAAYMSTIGTHLNWGSSYVVNDFYKRFVKPSATEKDLVQKGRISTVLLMVLAGSLSLVLTSATEAFNILLLSGAGSGAIYLLRWFWWRINAWSEIFAMVVSALFAFALVLIVDDSATTWGPIDGFTGKLLISVAATTVAWLVGTFVTKPESNATLRSFFRRCHPGGPGWAKVVAEARSDGDMIDEKIHGQAWEMPVQLLCVFLGCVAIYCSLFTIGGIVYGNLVQAWVLGGGALLSTFILFKLFSRLRTE
ncbi:sodium:solute symporter family protein [Bythopirellula polymerisocia]|nr:sodium:solute symporter family protein [Bythopirellula polymerisocia]